VKKERPIKAYVRGHVKGRKPTRNELAALEVEGALTLGLVLRAYETFSYCELTAGPYLHAVGARHWAIIPWGRNAANAIHEEFKTPRECAAYFVARVGSARACEAARKAFAKLV
jgi:hypothetical protein